ncbi:low temperature requirement protein A [uncultured Leifsonia sp.]|uniref:low temperature requirement protein A n=1 Tax=uncultured Leifsonia sp. TaxID=340359 RepID=UPI0028D12590|nr:low temperature requirement protein A [uncultured Leifsonia sp.]
MGGRDRATRRTATPFELFFDLVFVVSVSFAAENLHDLQLEGDIWSAFGSYAMVFFAIWWAWMNFTWFATAFDTDDWLYRLTTIAQMGGALVLAAGTESAMRHGDFTVVTAGYVVMTLAIVSQWTRAAIQSEQYRQACIRHAVGASIVQIAWVLRLALPAGWGVPAFFVLVAAELAVPVIADHRNWTPSNPHHVAERYGLFTLIVLGEGLLASAKAIIAAIDASEHVAPLIVIAGSGLIIVAAMWWLYFAAPIADGFTTYRSSFLYGYAHYLVFAAAGAVSAGLETAVTVQTGHPTAGAFAPTLLVPTLVFTVAVWLMAVRRHMPLGANWASAVALAALGAAAVAPLNPVGLTVATAAVLTSLVIVVVITVPTEINGADPTSGVG